MRVFSFQTTASEEDVSALIENMKYTLIDSLGKQYQGRICSILDDTNYVITKDTDKRFDFQEFKRHIFEQMKQLVPTRENGKNDLRVEVYLQSILILMEQFSYQQMKACCQNPEENRETFLKFKKFWSNFVNKNRHEQDTTNEVLKTVKCFVDNYDEIAKYALVNNHLFWKGLTYALNEEDIYSQKFDDVVFFLVQILAKKSLKQSEINNVMRLVDKRDFDALAKELRIDQKKARKLFFIYEDVARIINKFSYVHTSNLNSIIYENDFYKKVLRGELIENDKIRPLEVNGFVKLIKEMLYFKTDTVAFVQALSNSKNCAHRLFCVLNSQTTNSTVTHEFLHLISTNLVEDKFWNEKNYVNKIGFCVLNNDKVMGKEFNEFFTEYLALKISNEKDDRETSTYSSYLFFYNELFKKYEKELVESFLGRDFSTVFETFGKDNFLRCLKDAEDLYAKPHFYMDDLSALDSGDAVTKRRILKELKSTLEGEAVLESYLKVKEDLEKMLTYAQSHEK